MRLPGNWRAALVWTLAGVAALTFALFLVLFARDNLSPRMRRARTALAVGSIVAAVGAASIEISMLVFEYYGKPPVFKIPGAGKYNPTHTAVLMS